MKNCLWCLKNEKNTKFDNIAHTIPKSLGGKYTNPNICDECNSYFGNRNKKDGIGIEEIFKEAFGITKRRLQESGQVLNKRKINRFKSRYFEIRNQKGKSKLSIKKSFRLRPSYQGKLCRYFKRGLYKLYLEELNRQEGVGFEDKYNFIREFARYNLGDYPVFYFERKIGMILIFDGEMENPQLIFDRMDYLINKYGFSEIEFLGHVFGFPSIRMFELEIDNYLRETMESKTKFFKSIKPLRYLTDIDLTLDIMND